MIVAADPSRNDSDVNRREQRKQRKDSIATRLIGLRIAALFSDWFEDRKDLIWRGLSFSVLSVSSCSTASFRLRRRIFAPTLAASLPLCAAVAFLTRPAAGAETNSPVPAAATASSNTAPAQIVNYKYEVVNAYPHDRGAFTEGLDFVDGKLLESTGQYGESSLRAVDLTTGKVLRRTNLPRDIFGEGLAALNGKLYQLTWKTEKGYVYNLTNFAKLKEFTYTGEGWGLTTDGHWLIMSDGTSVIRFMDPETFKVDHTIAVTKDGSPQSRLNELEWVKGEIFANIWETDWIARIDPATGRIVGMIDLSHLLPGKDRDNQTEVLNGIAYDPAGDRLFVTGKYWPKIFEVRLKPVPPQK
jgi:glutamine cyclotransferase